MCGYGKRMVMMRGNVYLRVFSATPKMGQRMHPVGARGFECFSIDLFGAMRMGEGIWAIVSGFRFL